jgi:hypothetical protein
MRVTAHVQTLTSRATVPPYRTDPCPNRHGNQLICPSAGARSQGLAQLWHRSPSLRGRALAAPLRAFPSWFLWIECARRGREKYMAATHATLAGHGDWIIGEIIERMRHDGCGGQVGLVELLTGIPGSSHPVRRIVMRDRGYDRRGL